jgi:hypothetical protein
VCVVRVIASNGNTHTTRRCDSLCDFTDRSGIDRSGIRVWRDSRRSPRNVNGRASLSQHRGNALADTSGGSSYHRDLSG